MSNLNFVFKKIIILLVKRYLRLRIDGKKERRRDNVSTQNIAPLLFKAHIGDWSLVVFFSSFGRFDGGCIGIVYLWRFFLIDLFLYLSKKKKKSSDENS